MKEQIKIVNPTISHSIEILNYVWTIKKSNKPLLRDSIFNFFSKTKTYSKTALDFLSYHNILTIHNENIELAADVQVDFNGSKESALSIIKKRILHFQPFVEYMTFCAGGKKQNEAAKLVKDIYNISNEQEKIVVIFNSWIRSFGFSIGEFKISDKVFDSGTFNQDISKTIKAMSTLKDRFGDHFNQINQNVFDDLIEALKCYEDNPKKAVNDAGRALEDFLRINFAAGIDTKDCAGIVQIVNLLASQKLISAKQNGVVLGLGNIRSMGDAHGVDKNYTDRWMIRQRSALLYIEMVITTINSLLHFKLDQVLVF